MNSDHFDGIPKGKSKENLLKLFTVGEKFSLFKKTFENKNFIEFHKSIRLSIILPKALGKIKTLSNIKITVIDKQM